MTSLAVKFVCLSILAGATVAAWPQTAGDADAKAKVLALEHAWNQAEAYKDMKTLDEVFDDSMAYVDFDGTLLTKGEYLSRVKSTPFQQGITESMTAQVYDNVVIVTGIYTSKEIKSGKLLQRRGRFVDTWVRRGQSWVCVSAEATPVPH
jgi:hypothetical protein